MLPDTTDELTELCKSADGVFVASGTADGAGVGVFAMDAEERHPANKKDAAHTKANNAIYFKKMLLKIASVFLSDSEFFIRYIITQRTDKINFLGLY